MEVCLHHLHTAPLPFAEVASREVPAGLEALIFACLQKSQNDRPASGQELADALDCLKVGSWTRADAEAWWDSFGGDIDQDRESLSPSGTEQTLAIDLDER